MKKIIIALFLLSSLEAAPNKGRIAHGSAQFKSEGVKFSINQASEKLIVNWDSFSIGAHENVHFDQPSKKSVALNRVTGNIRSDILGSLTAKGKVYLVNPNGVLIGPEGKIKTSGFIASALEIANENFLSDKGYHFSGGKGAAVENRGDIRVGGGEVFLIGESVQNSGSIHAGLVGLLAGDEVLLKPEEESYVFFSAKAEEIEGSDIYSLAVNHEGLIESSGAEMRGGRVYLHAKRGKTKVSGKVEGESVHVLGEVVEVREGAQIDVSGKGGGGEVLIGGDYRGGNPDIQNARVTFVEKGSLVHVDALESGSGGKVIVWGEEKAHFSGGISARGGDFSGDGGFVEVSSPKNLIFSGGQVDTQAPNGKWGMLLLDPSDITISVAATDNPFNPPTTYDPVGVATANLNNTDLSNALATSNITVATSNGVGGNGMITVSANVSWSAVTTLSLLADRNILVSSGVTISSTNAGGFVAMDFEGNAGGASTGAFDGIVLDGATLSTVGGTILLEGRGGDTGNENFGIDLINTSLISSTGVGGIILLGTSGANNFSHAVRINNSQVTSIDGNIQITGVGTGNDSSFGLNMISSGSILSSGIGDVTLNVSSNASGAGPNGLRMATAFIRATDGTIDITATSNGAGAGGQGIVMQPGTIESLGTGDLMIDATGGTGTTSIALNVMTASVIRAGDGAIDITALAQGAGAGSHGISLATASSIESTGSGSMTISGTGSGDSGAGLFFSDGQILSTTGPIDITAVGAGTADGFTMTNAADRLGGAGSSGNILVSTDTITLAGETQSTGNLTMRTIGLAVSMGLGDSATGTFNLDNTELATIQDGFALRTFGRSDATNTVNYRIPSYADNLTILGNTIAVNANTTSSEPVTLTLNAGRTIDANNATIENTHTGSGNFSAMEFFANAAGLETGDFDGISLTTVVVESVEGNILLQGQGGTALGNPGIAILFNSQINSTGTGADAATINMTGLSGSGDTSQGILVGISSMITTVDGDITLSGTSVGTSSLSAGVVFDSSASIASTGTNPGGGVSIEGFGSPNGSSSTHGIQFIGTGVGITTTNGMVTLEGTAGGNGTATVNDGVQIISGALISSTGTGVNVAPINVTGTGGSGTSQNRGIFITASAGVGGIDTVDGNIVLDGTGGTNDNSAGILIQTNGRVRSLGVGANAGTIMVTGEGGVPGNNNVGILVQAVGISSVDGNITLNGMGGATGGAISNNGIVGSGGTISSSGTALMNITGTGAGTSGSGIFLVNADIINGSGMLTITGTGAGSSTALFMALAASQIGGGSGDIEITVENLSLVGGQVLGTGDLTIQPVNATTNIGLGTGASGTLNLNNPAIGTIQSGFNTVFFGRTDSTGTVEMQTFSFNPNPIIIRGATINVLGAVDNGAEDITFEIGVSGAGIGSTSINALVTTSGTFTVNGNAPTNNFTVGVGGLSATLNGGGTTNSLTGPDVVSAWTIDGNNQGTLNTTALFNTMQTLTGGSAGDTFTFTGPFAISGGINGGGGTNAVVSPALTTQWNITANNTGTIFPAGALTSTALTSIQSFMGGAANDTFTFDGAFNLSSGISGGGGTNEIEGPNVDTSWLILGSGSGIIFPSGAGATFFSSIQILAAGLGNDTFIFNVGSEISGGIDGGAGTNQVQGPNESTAWSITGNDQGNIDPASAGLTPLTNIQTFTGGSSSDVFTFTGPFRLTLGIGGGGGTNEVIGPGITTEWNITANDTGTIFPSGAPGSTTLANIQNFTGGEGNDTFTFDGAFSLSGGIIGGDGANRIEGPNILTTWNITGIDAGDITPMGTGATTFASVQTLVGGSDVDTFNITGAFVLTGSPAIDGGGGGNVLNGPDLITQWTITGNNAGTIFPTGALGSTSFANIQSLTGGNLDDRFTFNGAFQILGTSPGIDGGAGGTNEIVGPNVATTWIITAADGGSIEPTGAPGPTLFENIQLLTGGSADDTFDFSAGFTVSGTVDGGGGRNLIIGPNSATAWNLTSDNAGNAAGIVFINITDLTGGGGDDDFIFSDQVDFSGHINGGGGFNTLDYTAFTTPAIINPALQEASNLGEGYSNIQNIIGNVIFIVPPIPPNPDDFRAFIIDLSATLNQYRYYLTLWRTYEKGYQWFDSIYRKAFDSSEFPRWKIIVGKDAYSKFESLPR